MTPAPRIRRGLALLLAVAAGVAVLATGALAVATYVGDGPRAAEPLVVRDPASGAAFEVPGAGWEVRGARSRIFYADEQGRPAVMVPGPAVYRDGYCAAQPGDSNRGFAGFTRQSFRDWVAAVGGDGGWSTGPDRERVRLADGTPATLQWVGLLGEEGPCPATGIEVAMVSAGQVRVVVVADSVDDGTLTHDEVREILLGLELAQSHVAD
jgi:hypothetical protein